MRRRGVSPGISQRFEACSFLGDRPQKIKEIASGPRQSIEPGDNQYVTLCEDRDQAHQLLAIRSSTTDLLLKNLCAFGRFKLGYLRCQGLAVRTDTGVSIDGHNVIQFRTYIMHTIKPHSIRVNGFVHKS